MLNKNQEIELVIHDLHSNGFGVGKSELVVFVEGAIPGDHIRTKIIKVKKRYAYGKLMEIIRPSDDRLEKKDPRICPVAGQCGGCQFQHLEYSVQLVFKEKLVRDALIRIGKCENADIATIIGMDKPYNYRNKAQLPVECNGGQSLIGFYAPRSHRIVPIADCNIQHEVCGKVIKVVKKLYDVEIYGDLLRHVMIKVGFSTGDVMVVPVINGDELPYADRWIEALKVCLPEFTFVVNKNTANTNVVLGNKFTTLYGSGYIYEEIGHVKFRISPRAFFQVNPVQTKVLYDIVAGHLSGGERVIDAYCGIGSIALYIAEKVKEVVGVEFVEQAVEDGAYNAKLNGVTNAKFVCGLAEEFVPKLLSQASDEGADYDVLILDPPRKGCDGVILEAAITARVSKIIYVSCDPATLARDVGILLEGGFLVDHVQPVDMFPMTGHVETVILMSRKF